MKKSSSEQRKESVGSSSSDSGDRGRSDATIRARSTRPAIRRSISDVASNASNATANNALDVPQSSFWATTGGAAAADSLAPLTPRHRPQGRRHRGRPSGEGEESEGGSDSGSHHRSRTHHRSHSDNTNNNSNSNNAMAMFPSFLSEFQQTPGNNNAAASAAAAAARQISSPHPQNAPPVQSGGGGPSHSSSASSSPAQNGVIGTATTPISPASGGMFNNAVPLGNLGSGAGMNSSGGGRESGGLNSAMPIAPGHQMDLNYIWQLVEELSSVLAENRESTEGIMRQAGELQRRALKEVAERRGAPANMTASEVLEALHGVIPGRATEQQTGEGANAAIAAAATAGGRSSSDAVAATAAAAAATIADLQAQNEALRERNAFLQNECIELDGLVTDHVSAIETILQLVRNFSHNNTQAIINIHRSYQEQLDAERQTNMDLRNEHFEWQARLMNLAALLREAYRESTNEEALTEVALIAGLRSENRALRRHIGLPVDDSDDDVGASGGGGNNAGNDGDTRHLNPATTTTTTATTATATTSTTTGSSSTPTSDATPGVAQRDASDDGTPSGSNGDGNNVGAEAS